MQQLLIIKDFIFRKKINTIVIPCKTVREKNGIACSSRNLLLSKRQKLIASKVYKLIVKKKNKLINKEISIKKIKILIHALGVKNIDYIKKININNIVTQNKKHKKYKIFVAYFLGSTRLIDNI